MSNVDVGARTIEINKAEYVIRGLGFIESVSDIENSAIVRMTPEGKLQTLVKTDKLRWPDGFSLGPDKHLYVTCSSLHQVIGLDPESVRSTAPYQIYRVKLPLTDD